VNESSAKPATPLLLLWIIAIGAVVRFAYNDVTSYSSADEAHYVTAARVLSEEGWSKYPDLIRDQLDHPAEWFFPTRLRWGYLGLTTLACAVRSPCDARALAWLSTLAGIASIAFTFLLGARLVGRRAATLAAALTITSPLQLAMGRRALQDEVCCAVWLAALWALIRLLQGEGDGRRARARERVATFVALATLSFAMKESFAFLYVAFVAIYLAFTRGRRLRIADAATLVAPPALAFGGFVLLSGSASSFFALLRVTAVGVAAEYGLQYQSGPPHRVLFDLFLLAPLVCVIGAGALWAVVTARREDRGGERWLTLFFVIAVAAFMGLPKNLRFTVILDPILRILAAWALVTMIEARGLWSGWLAVVALANAGVELYLFHTIFIRGAVYDPTTYDVLYALRAVPTQNPEPTTWGAFPAAFFPAVVVVAASLRWDWHRKLLAATSRASGPGAS